MFKIKNNYGADLYRKTYTKEWVNFDWPDIFYKGIKVYDGSYGVLTCEYFEMKKEDQKAVYNFLKLSIEKFYKWAETWKNPIYRKENDTEHMLFKQFENSLGKMGAGKFLNKLLTLWKAKRAPIK